MAYHHIDIFSSQSSKKINAPCGDVFGVQRDDFALTVVLADGIGSGIKANIYANLCKSRIFGLLKYGATLRESFSAMVGTMNKAWGTTEPFAVFTVMQILHNGNVTVLSYDMPPPILVSRNGAYVLNYRVYPLEKAIISEVNTKIELGDGVVLFSDGITQAGLGNGLTHGWEIKGVEQYIRQYLLTGSPLNQQMINYIHQKALQLWGKKIGDDCSVVYAKSRSGIIVNLLTGPPSNKEKDAELVEAFTASPGIKIICGGSTAKMVARELNRTLEIDLDSESMITPPAYLIEGMNLVTEGVVTLNQVFNILDENVEEIKEKTKVIQICEFFHLADRVNIFTGDALNLGAGKIEFRQQGIVNRRKILDLICKKLQEMGKLVVKYNF